MLRYVQNEKCNDPRNKALNQYEKSFKSQENSKSESF